MSEGKSVISLPKGCGGFFFYLFNRDLSALGVLWPDKLDGEIIILS